MLRTNGTYKFYKIQHQWEKGSEWVFSAYGIPKINSKKDNFTACGRCWQITGEHGVFDIRNARAGLKRAEKNVEIDFNKKEIPKLPLRIVCVKIIQKTTPIK